MNKSMPVSSWRKAFKRGFERKYIELVIYSYQKVLQKAAYRKPWENTRRNILPTIILVIFQRTTITNMSFRPFMLKVGILSHWFIFYWILHEQFYLTITTNKYILRYNKHRPA